MKIRASTGLLASGSDLQLKVNLQEQFKFLEHTARIRFGLDKTQIILFRPKEITDLNVTDLATLPLTSRI